MAFAQADDWAPVGEATGAQWPTGCTISTNRGRVTMLLTTVTSSAGEEFRTTVYEEPVYSPSQVLPISNREVLQEDGWLLVSELTYVARPFRETWRLADGEVWLTITRVSPVPIAR